MKNKNLIYDLVRYNLTIALLFIVGFFLHGFIMVKFEYQVPFSVLSMYIFFAIASSVIISGVLLLRNYLPNQLGYLFLMAVFLKLGVFLMVYSEDIFTDNPLNMPAKLSILTPLFLFLVYEGFILIKQLNYIFK